MGFLGQSGHRGRYPAPDAPSALKGVNIALFPIPGMSEEGHLFAPRAPAPITPDRGLLLQMRQPAHIILGWADEALRASCEALGTEIYEYEKDEDLMLLRGPAIVEGCFGSSSKTPTSRSTSRGLRRATAEQRRHLNHNRGWGLPAPLWARGRRAFENTPIVAIENWLFRRGESEKKGYALARPTSREAEIVHRATIGDGDRVELQV